jgi:hypothetical protein
MNKTTKLKIKPKHFLSLSYNLFNNHGGIICELIYPMLNVLLGINVAYLKIDNQMLKIIDAEHHVGMISNRSVNTYIEINGEKMIEIEYPNLGSNEIFYVNYEGEKFSVVLKGHGVREISHGNEVIGYLKIKDFIFRRSEIKFNKEASVLLHAMIFWGSVNTKEFRALQWPS